MNVPYFIRVTDEFTRAEKLVNLDHIHYVKCGDRGEAVLVMDEEENRRNMIFCAETYAAVSNAIWNLIDA